MIPKIVHHVWPAHDPIPYTFRSNLASWQAHHHGWTHRLWTEADLADMPMHNRDLYDAAKELAPDDWIRWRADIARLEIVYKYGGIYADMDAVAVASLEPLLDLNCWFAESPNAHGYATQAVFGAVKEHSFLWHLLQALPTSAATHSGKRINHRVGSRFVARNVQTYEPADAVSVLPWDWFAAQSIKGRGYEAPITPRYVDHQYWNSQRHAAHDQIMAFKAAADILNGAEITWFLTSGLLLGHVREGRFLPWDGDVDVGIFPEDADRARAAFKAEGWPFKRDFDSQMWPVHGNIKIDLHNHYREGDTVYKLHGKQQRIKMSHPAHLFDNLTPTVFYMRDTLMPSPPEEYLEIMYGEDWLTPKPTGWRWDKDPKNITHI